MVLKAGPRTLAREKYFRRTHKGKAWIRRTYLPKAKAWEGRLDTFRYEQKKAAGLLGEVCVAEFATQSYPAAWPAGLVQPTAAELLVFSQKGGERG